MLGQQPDVRLIVHPLIQTYIDRYHRPQIHTYGDHVLGQPCFCVFRVASGDSTGVLEVSLSGHKSLWYDLEKLCRTGSPMMDEQISM